MAKIDYDVCFYTVRRIVCSRAVDVDRGGMLVVPEVGACSLRPRVFKISSIVTYADVAFLWLNMQ